MFHRILVATVVTASAILAQSPSRLLAPIDDVPAAAQAWVAQQKKRDPAVVRSRFVRIDTAALRQLPGRTGTPLASFALDLFGERRVLDVKRWKRALDYDVFVGNVRGRAEDVHVVLAADGVVAASLHLVETSYAVQYTGVAGVHVLQQRDPSRNPLRCAAHQLPAQPVDGRRAKPGNDTGPLDDSGNTIIDVLFAYTPTARSNAGGKSGIEVAILGSIEQANATNRASALPVTFRVVHMTETNYRETGSTADLSRFRSRFDGRMDEVHALRETYGADLMHLITQPVVAGYCGVAYLMTNLSTGFRSSAFGVTVLGCMMDNVVAHEIGHNIGCHHDRNNAGGAIYPYSYGFRSSDNAVRTVMAYSPGRRVNVWSSPNVRYQNYVMGRVNREDNVRSIKTTRATVASFTPMRTLLWCDAGGGIPGFFGIRPVLYGSGTTDFAKPARITIDRYRPDAPGLLVIGSKKLNLPFLGGTLVPDPAANIVLLGNRLPIQFDASFLRGLKPGTDIWFQAFFLDNTAVRGVSGTHALKVTRP